MHILRDMFGGMSLDDAPPPPPPPPYAEPRSFPDPNSAPRPAPGSSRGTPRTSSPTPHRAPTSSSAARPWPPHIKPTNHLSLSSTYDHLRGSYVINPRLRLPPALHSGSTRGEGLNLKLHNVHGDIDAEIWVLDDTKRSSANANREFAGPSKAKTSPTNAKVNLRAESSHGRIVMCLHDHPPCIPIYLTAKNVHGDIFLRLPRTFRGLLALQQGRSVCGPRIHFSRAMEGAMIPLGEDVQERTRRWFIGDIDCADTNDDADTDAEWRGDEVRVEASMGRVHVCFADERPARGPPRGGRPPWVHAARMRRHNVRMAGRGAGFAQTHIWGDGAFEDEDMDFDMDVGEDADISSKDNETDDSAGTYHEQDPCDTHIFGGVFANAGNGSFFANAGNVRADGCVFSNTFNAGSVHISQGDEDSDYGMYHDPGHGGTTIYGGFFANAGNVRADNCVFQNTLNSRGSIHINQGYRSRHYR